MGEYVKRERYLQRLIDRRDNGDVKIITGPRRSGKSFLLKTIYRDYLLSQGVPSENIIIVSLDEDDENNQSELASRKSHILWRTSYITNCVHAAISLTLE